MALVYFNNLISPEVPKVIYWRSRHVFLPLGQREASNTMARRGVPRTDKAARLLSSSFLVKYRETPIGLEPCSLLPISADHLASEHCFSLIAWYLASPQQSVCKPSLTGWGAGPTSPLPKHSPSALSFCSLPLKPFFFFFFNETNTCY